MKPFSVVVARLVSSGVVHVDIQCRSYSFIKQLEAISIKSKPCQLEGFPFRDTPVGIISIGGLCWFTPNT